MTTRNPTRTLCQSGVFAASIVLCGTFTALGALWDFENPPDQYGFGESADVSGNGQGPENDGFMAAVMINGTPENTVSSTSSPVGTWQVTIEPPSNDNKWTVSTDAFLVIIDNGVEYLRRIDIISENPGQA